MGCSEIHAELGSLRRALGEERAVRRAEVTALWSAIDDLQNSSRCRATVEPGVPGAAQRVHLAPDTVKVAVVPSVPEAAQRVRLAPDTVEVAVGPDSAREGTMAKRGAKDAGLPDKPTSRPRPEAGRRRHQLDSTMEEFKNIVAKAVKTQKAKHVHENTQLKSEIVKLKGELTEVRAMLCDPEKSSEDDHQPEKSSSDDHQPAAAVSACIDDLPPEILKPILGFLDCPQLLEASQVCRRWYDMVDDIVDDITQKRGCPMMHSESCQNKSWDFPKPASNVHLQLMVLHSPRMSKLQLPEGQHPLLDLNVVANTCQNLKTVDLRGFHVDTQSLGKLAEQNNQLKDVTLPAGCSVDQLEALLRPLTDLKTLTVESPHGTGRWLKKLPLTLETIYISGLEARLERWWPQAGLPDIRCMSLRGCSGVTDFTLACLPDLVPNLTKLCISECSGVTDGGLLHVGRLSRLEHLTLHDMPAGINMDAGQDCPEDTGRWLQKLPEGLETLDFSLSGLESPLDPERLEKYWNDLTVSISHVNDSTLARLTVLAPRLQCLYIGDFTGVTASGLFNLGRLTELKRLTLHVRPANVITDAGQNCPADIERLLQELPEKLWTLDIIGLEAPLEQLWPQTGLPELKNLSLRGCSGVTDSTLACLPDLAPHLTKLRIADCTQVTTSGLLHTARLTALTKLTLHGLPASFIKDVCQDNLDETRQYLKELTGQDKTRRSVKILSISGLEASLEPWRPNTNCHQHLVPSVSIRHVTDSTLALLTDLDPKALSISDCPLVTASGLLHVSRLTKLKHLTLHGVPAGVITDDGQENPEDTGRWLKLLPESLGTLTISDCPDVTASDLLHIVRLTVLLHLTLHGVSAGSITDAVLDGLNSCSELRQLRLGHRVQPQETAITAAAVSRLVVACQKMYDLRLHTTAASSQAVLDALHHTDLGYDYNRPRTITVSVPDSINSQLRRLPSGSKVKVKEWYQDP